MNIGNKINQNVMRNPETNLKLLSNKELGILVLQAFINLKDCPTFKEINDAVLRLATRDLDFEDNPSIRNHFRSFKVISQLRFDTTNMLGILKNIGFIQELPNNIWALNSEFIDIFSQTTLNEIYDIERPFGSPSIEDILSII